MKRLEGEVVNLIRDLSAGQASFDTEGLTVDPHQFLGLELNPRAAAIAEIVLWIGYICSGTIESMASSTYRTPCSRTFTILSIEMRCWNMTVASQCRMRMANL